MKHFDLNFKYKLLIYIILSFTVLVGFYYGEDGYANALSGDFRDTWPYVINLNKNFFIDPSAWTTHPPLHYFILAKIYLIFKDPWKVRLIFCFISLILPFLFYLCLIEKFKNTKKLILFIISLIIFIIPGYRYSAVWANNHITALIFILAGTYFFLKEEKEGNEKKIKKNIFLYLFFFTLACYTRQHYAFLYGVILLRIYFKYNLKYFIIFGSISLLFALPGIFFLLNYPGMYNTLIFSGNLSNTFLGNISMTLIYTLPIIGISIVNKKFKYLKEKININFLISLAIFIIILFTHNIKTMDLNGGVFLFFSKKFFNNYLLLYLTFFINVFFLLSILDSNFDRLTFISINLMISGIVVLSKYFEPLIIFYLFFYTKSKYNKIILLNLKNSLLFLSYYILYYTITATKILHKINF